MPMEDWAAALMIATRSFWLMKPKRASERLHVDTRATNNP